MNKSSGIQCDQTDLLITHYPAKNYPEPLHRIRFYDAEKDKRLVHWDGGHFPPNLQMVIKEALERDERRIGQEGTVPAA
jgi:calcineurin-like phosphoesterase family protein